MTKDWSQRRVVDDWIEDERILQMSQAELEVELARQGDSFRSAVARARASVLLAKDKAANRPAHISHVLVSVDKQQNTE